MISWYGPAPKAESLGHRKVFTTTLVDVLTFSGVVGRPPRVKTLSPSM